MHRDAVGEEENEEPEIEEEFAADIKPKQVRPAEETLEVEESREGPFDRYFSEAAT